tara:strand:+ start:3058 stop:3783 length:726 start_codon:yes stop_codon:yes gene_type:complete
MSNHTELNAFTGVNKLYIDDDIGKDGITAKKFKDELNKQRGAIEIYINSAGGVVTEGIAIYNSLKAYTGKKTVIIDSLAASMASVIAMAGDVVQMPSNGLMMIHNPWGASSGQAKEHRKTADLLDVMKEAMLAAYRLKTNLDETQLSELMDEETWMNGEDCLKLGFIDTLSDSVSENKITAQFHQVCIARTQEVQRSEQAISADVRETAAKICHHRKMPQPANLFKSQNDKPTHYSEIKNV